MPSFEQIIAGLPPYGGDSGEEFANKINSNFALVNQSLESVITQMGNINSALGSLNTAVVNKLDKTNGVGSGSLSINRKANTTVGTNSVAVGTDTTASGNSSFAEGSNTVASGNYSHAEGYNTTASNTYSHAEGYNTTASNTYSHAEGQSTTASGADSHAEGQSTTAFGDCSHAEGRYTIATGINQHVQGKYNVIDNTSTYADIVGNGTATSARKNISALDWDGNLHLKGDVYAGCNDDSTGGTKVAKIGDALSVFVDDSTHRLVTDTQISAWNGKQDALQFMTAPSASNKVATAADLSGVSADTIEVTYNNSASVSRTISPNSAICDFYSSGMTSIALTLTNTNMDVVCEWSYTFKAGNNCSLSVTSPTNYTLVWKDGVPTFTSGLIYEISFRRFKSLNKVIAYVAETQLS